jgi:hypothetical protein
MTFPSSFEGIGDRGVSATVASTEMISQNIAIEKNVSVGYSGGTVCGVGKGTYLRLKVLEQNLQLYGLSPESIHAVRSHVLPNTNTTLHNSTHAAVDAAVNGLSVGISSRTGCRSIGFEPPF